MAFVTPVAPIAPALGFAQKEDDATPLPSSNIVYDDAVTIVYDDAVTVVYCQ